MCSHIKMRPNALSQKEVRSKVHVVGERYRCNEKAIIDATETTQYRTNRCIIYRPILSVLDRLVEKRPYS